MNMHELIGAVDVQALASGWWTSALAVAQRVDAATLLWVAAACWFAAGVVALRAARTAQRRLAHRLARLEELANATSMDLKTLLREGERFQDDRRETLEAVALVRERQDELELHVAPVDAP